MFNSNFNCFNSSLYHWVEHYIAILHYFVFNHKLEHTVETDTVRKREELPQNVVKESQTKRQNIDWMKTEWLSVNRNAQQVVYNFYMPKPNKSYSLNI